MTRVCAVAALLIVLCGGDARAQAYVVGQTYAAVAEHPGAPATGFRLRVNGTQVGPDVPVTALVRIPGTGNCSGVWSIGPNNEILRDGKHTHGGYGSEVRCVSNAVWALGSNSLWWRLVNGAWQQQSTVPSGGTVLHVGGEVRLPVTFKAAGVYSLEIAAFDATEEAKSTPLVVTVTAPPAPLTPPTNIRLGAAL